MGLIGYLNTLLSALTGDVNISSPANLDILEYNSSTSKWVNRQGLPAEQNSTPVAGANDTAVGTANRYYTMVTLPSTAPAYLVTGIEVLNGTVVNGDLQLGIDYVDASPPVSNQTALRTWTVRFTQSGASAVQRFSILSGTTVFPAGQLLGLWLVSSSATARYGTTTVASNNRLKALAIGAGGDIALANTGTAWSAGTEEPYIKLYYRPILGV